ncbi:RCC1 repeat-containing protein [Histomonas meleagridis]|uniref:RCC1 repeat-containing protein n=1 Tax=Histomonas meleagridis TaxID=135588 RepID=UPI00355A269F|nr:RCC1 repeat-containing protein [Histomonas meleagridis]KAH0805466.1 RCC1 repeat-containing protein [Histomonas meleagridis]
MGPIPDGFLYKEGNYIKPGNVWIWGHPSTYLGVKGDSEKDVCYPVQITSLKNIVYCDCSSTETGVVTKEGFLYTWGSNYKHRLLQDIDDTIYSSPTKVSSLSNVSIFHISETHSCVILNDGTCLLWGSTLHGALGNGEDGINVIRKPIPAVYNGEIIKVSQACLSYCSTMLLSYEGEIFVSGSNEYGKIGLGKSIEKTTHFTKLPFPPCRYISMGSLYTLIITFDNEVLGFGIGKNGNLGIGKRVNIQYEPIRITFPTTAPIIKVCASIEENTPTTIPISQIDGNEGPTSFACDLEGRIYGFGSSHKGKLGNFENKVLNPRNGDELSPFLIGSITRDTKRKNCYFQGEEVIQVISCHIHSAALTKSGKLYTWGCGSGGRIGQDGFIFKGRKRRLKFYQSKPTAIETFARNKTFVCFAASARSHMICIGK